MKLRVVRALNLLLVFVPVFGFAAVANPVRIDFSYAGYQAGGQPLPAVPAVISVRPSGKDDTDLLQSAIDHVAALPLDAHGYRGAVLLRPGRFHVAGHLRLNASGVILRGSGSGAARTTILADGLERRTLTQAGGSTDPVLGEAVGVTDETVAAGSRLLTVASNFRPERWGSRRCPPTQHAGVDQRDWDERPAWHVCQPAPGLAARLARPGVGQGDYERERCEQPD
jgi:hypothetical protein